MPTKTKIPQKTEAFMVKTKIRIVIKTETYSIILSSYR